MHRTWATFLALLAAALLVASTGAATASAAKGGELSRARYGALDTLFTTQQVLDRRVITVNHLKFVKRGCYRLKRTDILLGAVRRLCLSSIVQLYNTLRLNRCRPGNDCLDVVYRLSRGFTRLAQRSRKVNSAVRRTPMSRSCTFAIRKSAVQIRRLERGAAAFRQLRNAARARNPTAFKAAANRAASLRFPKPNAKQARAKFRRACR